MQQTVWAKILCARSPAAVALRARCGEGSET
jgi:hypothetical protein